MRVSWDAHRDAVLRLIRESRGMDDLRPKIELMLGRSVSTSQIDSAYRGWAERWPLPKLPALYGADLIGDAAPTAAALSLDAPPLELVQIPEARASEALNIPPAARAPDPPPAESLYIHSGDVPRLVFSDGDNHYGTRDRVVENAKLAWLRDVRPDVHVNVGDQYDAFGISRYEKPASRSLSHESTLLAEFREARDYWKTIAEVCRESHFILGNHERRLEALVNANPALFGLLDWGRLAELPPVVSVHGHGSRIRIGAVSWEHGDRVGGRFGVLHPSYWLLSNKGHRSTVFGHTHRIECRLKTVYDENQEPHIHGAWNQGHGSSVPDAWRWCPDANWQHGWTCIEMFTVAGKARFSVHQIVVIDGRFSWHGKIYDGRKCM